MNRHNEDQNKEKIPNGSSCNNLLFVLEKSYQTFGFSLCYTLINNKGCEYAGHRPILWHLD